MKALTLTGVAVTLAVIAGVAQAQTPDRGVMARHTDSSMPMAGMTPAMGSCPMMAEAEPEPQAALAYADELGLTAEQRQQLTSLQQAIQAARDALTPEQRAMLGRLEHRKAMDGMMRMMSRMGGMMGPSDETMKPMGKREGARPSPDQTEGTNP